MARVDTLAQDGEPTRAITNPYTGEVSDTMVSTFRGSDLVMVDAEE